jgi:NADPH-dependent glutamate synthase beta subunit-like oxidoreductase
MKRSIAVLACAACALGAALASAQTLYKLVDKNGKVTYSESAPKPGEFDGQVTRIEVNTKGNTATLPRYEPRPAEPATNPGKRMNDPVGAKEKLEAAKKALADARDNPSPEEVTRMGTKSGFTRPVESEAYKARLAKLEADVKAAEEELKRAEGR